MKAPKIATKFRLISLCNIPYRIFMKLLVNRLKPLMSKLSQLVCLVEQEIFLSLGNRVDKGAMMALKFDMGRA